MYPHLECRVRTPSALYSRQRYAGASSLLCRSPLVLLQDAAVARIAGEHDVVAAVENGDVERVRDHVIADPACVHETYSLWCDARLLHMPLQKKAGLRFCFERCNSCLLFSGKTALHLSSQDGHNDVEVCKLLVESQADVNVKDIYQCDARL